MPSQAQAGSFEAFFAAPPSGGQRLCLHTMPRGPVRGAILQVHAFGEEMNKMRRMSALAARALAANGFEVMQIDLQGCGDSSGDFGDCSWSGWLSDVAWAADWLRRRQPAPLWLWGQRAGALVASAATGLIDGPCELLLWNPVLQGKAVMQQLVRLKAAGEWASGEGKAVTSWVKAELGAGRAVDIAGYTISPGLAHALEAAVAAPPTRPGGRVAWLEVAGREGEPTLSPAAQVQIPRWQAAGHQVHARAVSGPTFWQTAEIEEAPALVDATVEALLALEPVTA